ncbi:MAG: RluA family pseudouridine synthase [Planctomycetes bacterium]|nr:RluA family pseudouridine synthase [Planctomycetota bacterium]
MVDVPLLYEDAHLAIVDKPANVLVVTAPGRREPTLVDLLRRQLGGVVEAVHRLDEQTTGAIVVARDAAGRAGMEALFRRHAVERDYLALVTAAPSPPAGSVESQLREDAGGVMRVVPRGGERAVTHYETLCRRDRCTLVRCRLETGRRNQIRAHFAAMGCPIAGDRKYGYRRRADEAFARVMLHSWRVAFRHPVTGQQIAVEAPPPEPELQP